MMRSFIWLVVIAANSLILWITYGLLGWGFFSLGLAWVIIGSIVSCVHWGWTIASLLLILCSYIGISGNPSILGICLIVFPLVSGTIIGLIEHWGYLRYVKLSRFTSPITSRAPPHKATSLTHRQSSQSSPPRGYYQTPQKVACPRCGSIQVKSAGYSDRLECGRCGRIFSR